MAAEQSTYTGEVEPVGQMTEWASEPTVKDLQDDYEAGAIEQQKFLARLAIWRDYYHIRGEARPEYRQGRSQHQPRLIRKQAEWRYPGLTEPFHYTNKVFNVAPRTYADSVRAKQNQLVLNYQFNTKIGKVAFIDKVVRSTVDEGTACIRVGWKSKEMDVTREEPVYELRIDETGENRQWYEELLQLMEVNPRQAEAFMNPGLKRALVHYATTGIVTVPKVIGYNEITEEGATVENRPDLTVCPIDNVVFDPTCEGNLENAGFLIYSYETSISELKADTSVEYKNLDRIKVGDHSPHTDPEHKTSPDNGSFNFKDHARKKMVIREYWGEWDIDGNGTTKPIVAAWIGNTLVRLEENPMPDKKIPFVLVHYMPKKDSTYAEPDAELLIDNQRIIGALSRGMIDLMGRSANSQTGMRSDLLDIVNRRKYLRGEDYEYNPTVDPRTAIFTHTYPEIPQSAFNLLNINQAEAEGLTGVTGFSQGLTGQNYGQLAAGVRGVLDAASLRESSILRRIKDALAQVGRKMIAMNAEWLSDEEVVRITDDHFVTVRRDDLPGNYDIELNIATAEEDNKRAEELSFVLQTIGPNAPQELVYMIMAEIADLRRMPALAHSLRTFKPTPDPIAQQSAILDMELKISEIQKNYAAAEKDGMAAGLNRAKAVTEETEAVLNQAKTRALGSKADLDDLQFLEQESGVTQARDVERISAQSTAQGQTKILEHLLREAEKTPIPMK